MGTYTSTQDGPWNDVNTWGGGGYPQLTNDVFNIGHLVTLNVRFDPATVAFGQGNINNNGILTFARDMSTRLPFGHQDLVINSGGWLKVGESGLVIPKEYLAELVWKTTGDNSKGINIANGGKLSIYGDPGYFGSADKTTLISEAVIPAAGNAVTLTVAGDFTTKWSAGQELLVHKGGAYGTTGYSNDFCRLAITEVAANGSNTDVACTVIQRPADLTCLVGADVLHLTRNVMLYKYAYNGDLGQINTLRPRLTNANAAGTANVNMSDVSIAGFYGAMNGNNVFFNGVVRNSHRATSALSLSTVNGIICMCYDGSYTINNCLINAWTVSIQNIGCRLYESTIINGNILGTAVIAITGVNNTINGHMYSNNVVMEINNGVVITGNIGYDGAGVQKSNTTDFVLAAGRYITTLINSLTKSAPVFTNRNTLTYNSRIRFEHFLQGVGDHYVADAFGDIYKVAADGSGDHPSQRSGGGTEVLEVVPQTNCAANALLELFNIRLWAEAGVSKTYRFYVQTDFATLPAAELKLEGQYLDAGSGGHLATVSSVQDIATRANAADWSQYVEVTINPAQEGYVNLYLRLMGYEADKKVWVDPKVAITGGDTVSVTPRWSYGEVQLDIDPVGRVSPSNLGLVPLGIKQVAI